MSTSNWEVNSTSSLGKIYSSTDKNNLFIVANSPITTEHLARSWREINQEEAHIIEDPILGQGIMVPNHRPVSRLSTNETIDQLLSTYERTGKVVFDKHMDFYKDASGNIYINKVFLALNLTQKHSDIDKSDQELFECFVNTESFKKNTLDYIKCTLKALAVISKYRPDIDNLSFLSHNIPSIITISYGFNPQNPGQLEHALHLLNVYSPEAEELGVVKDKCTEILSTYKTSKENEFSIHPANTRRKIEVLDELMENIQSAHFLEDIIRALQHFLSSNRQLLNNPHHHGGLFRQVVKECLELPQFKDISSIYALKESCIDILENYQHSKKTLAWAKSFYSKSQNKIFALDNLIDQIIQSKTPLEISLCINQFKDENKDLFKKQTGELMDSLQNCETKIQEYLENQVNAPAAAEKMLKK